MPKTSLNAWVKTLSNTLNIYFYPVSHLATTYFLYFIYNNIYKT